MPNVVNLTQAAATSAITGAGLIVGTVTNSTSATVPAGSVISQNPIAGTQVATGSAVNLVVSTGPPPVAVPNVVNLTQAAATSAITGAGLIVGTVTNSVERDGARGFGDQSESDRRDAGRRPAARSTSSSRPARRPCRCPTSST